MKKNTGLWMILSSLIFVFLVYFSWQKFGATNASAEILSKQAAQKLVQDRYQGAVIQIQLADRQYHIEFEKEQTVYNIDLDAVNGKVLSFTKKGTNSQPSVHLLSEDELRKIILTVANGTITSLEKLGNEGNTLYNAVVKEGNKQTSLTVDAITGKILSSNATTINESSKKLTETEAKEIAKKQVNGVVDQIWLETNEKQTFYLVEIETQDDKEAIVQIHAITGNVMSVSWDDHSNDDDSKHRSADDEKNDDSKHRDKNDKQDDDDD